MQRLAVALGLTMSSVAWAEVDPNCQGLPIPADYNEQVQQDFQSNYFALTSSFSGVHAPVPHAPGRGSFGVHVNVMPPLSCEKRFVLNWTKTEDTNKSPVLPRFSATYAFPKLFGRVVPYAGFAFLPPVAINGTRNLIVSGEMGVGVEVIEHFDVGTRVHMSSQRTYGDIATAFSPEEPSIEDVYLGGTWGVDLLLGAPVTVGGQELTPFVSVGYLNASTFFFVGDSSFAANNLHPYSGLAFAAGLDTLLAGRLRLGAEFYGAPGGYSLPQADVESVAQASRYGRLYTARLRIGVEL